MITSKKLFILFVVLSLLVLILVYFPEIGILRDVNIFVLWLLLALSGLALVIVTCKQGITGKPKLFLLLAGYSAVGFMLGIVLHNLFYALAIMAEQITILNTILNILEVGTFLIAVILCPIGLLVGIIGTFVLWKQIPA